MKKFWIKVGKGWNHRAVNVLPFIILLSSPRCIRWLYRNSRLLWNPQLAGHPVIVELNLHDSTFFL